MSGNTNYSYDMNSKSSGFAEIQPWDVDIDGIKITWVPAMPYIMSNKSPEAQQIVDEINKFIIFLDADEDKTFRLTPVGPILPANASSPFTVRYAIESIYADDTDLVFSETAPDFFMEDDADEVILGPESDSSAQGQSTN
jgi:hypothetical protein